MLWRDALRSMKHGGYLPKATPPPTRDDNRAGCRRSLSTAFLPQQASITFYFFISVDGRSIGIAVVANNEVMLSPLRLLFRLPIGFNLRITQISYHASFYGSMHIVGSYPLADCLWRDSHRRRRMGNSNMTPCVMGGITKGAFE